MKIKFTSRLFYKKTGPHSYKARWFAKPFVILEEFSFVYGDLDAELHNLLG